MSAVLDKLETELVNKIRELQLAVEEYNRLTAAADSLGIKWNGNGRHTPTRSREEISSQPAKPKRQRPSKRRDDILRLVIEQPGITVKGIGDTLGLPNATSLYPVVRGLAEAGALRKDGTALYPGNGATA